MREEAPVASTDRSRLAGKVCIVTGAASGIGRAVARLFAAQGASVIVADLTTEVIEGGVPTVARRRTPWPRLGRPDDVARAALFLASSDASFVTGAELMVDGGWMAA